MPYVSHRSILLPLLALLVTLTGGLAVADKIPLQEQTPLSGRQKIAATILSDIGQATWIAEGKGPSQWVASLGYAGWGEAQLEEEMTRHGWFAAEGSPAILFDTPTDERWAAAYKAHGVDPRLLSSETGVA